MPYRHTQRGTLIMFLCLVLAAVDAAIAWRTGQLMPVAVLIILVAVAFLFSSLTVEVNGNELRWHFGPGFWIYRLALDEIETVAVVHNHWWNGFGIRTGPGFRLYNVSGLDAVELHLRSSDIRRIGTDDPQELADALKASRSAP
jgi:putative component of toxin-antitoxin plasmid stabilization module